jgi:2-hydroxy-3-oxopropionate reductase
VISLLENGTVVGEVLFGMGGAGAVHGMHEGSLFIDMASIQPREARDHASRLAERGLRHLDAPVSGGTVGADNGTLAIMAGGRAEDFAAALPVFAALGRATHVGPHGAGQLAKLANQMIVGITIGAVAEALLLCAKGGADMAKVREAISGGFADSRILQLHGQRMVERDFARTASMRCSSRTCATPWPRPARSASTPPSPNSLPALRRRRGARPGRAGPQRPVRGAGQPQRAAVKFLRF